MRLDSEQGPTRADSLTFCGIRASGAAHRTGAATLRRGHEKLGCGLGENFVASCIGEHAVNGHARTSGSGVRQSP